MSNSSQNVEENISETTSDTANLISNDEAGTSSYTRHNKEANLQVKLALLFTIDKQ